VLAQAITAAGSTDGAKIKDAKFYNVDLTDANLSGVDMSSADFGGGSGLESACGDDTTKVYHPALTLRKCD